MTITKIEYFKYQKYLYFKSAFGIVATAPINKVNIFFDEDDYSINIEINEIEVDIFLSTIQDENFRWSLLETLDLADLAMLEKGNTIL